MRTTLPFLQLACMFACCIGSSATAALLTGSGPHLPISSPNPAWPPGVSPAQVQTGPTFVGSWSPPANSNWTGGFYSAVGQIPSSFATGLVRYDFTTMPLGYLPAGTFFIFGDVDGGSGNPERFDLTAYDNTSAIISNEWLGEVSGPNSVYSVRPTGGTGGGGTVVPTNMPGWSWQGTNPNGYHITGASVGSFPNPAVAFALVTNQPIYQMDLNKPTTHYGFSMQAPVGIPEPSSVLLVLGSCVTALAVRRCIEVRAR